MPLGLALVAASVLAAGISPAEGSAPARAARFEGVIAMRLTLDGANGNMTLSLAPGGARLELKVASTVLPLPVTLTILHRDSVPGRVILLDGLARTWSELDLAEARRLAASGNDAPYAVKVLGKARHLGRDVTKLTLKREGEFVEAWVAEDLADAFSVLKTLQQANPQVGEAGLFRALEESGHAGLPMRFTVIREGQKVTTEVTKVERKAVPASAFAVPAGYRRAEPAGAPAPAAEAGRR